MQKDLFLFPPRQKPEKLSVGSMLLVVSLMAVGACVTSLAFGKLSVSIISRILSSINLLACFLKAFCDQSYHGLYFLFWKLYLWMMAPPHLQDIVYNRPKTLDSTFDAGGDTSSTLIAVSNMCEFVNIQTILGESRICASSSISNRESQKKQKSEFWYATNPTGFDRLDEPPEKFQHYRPINAILQAIFSFTL